MTRSIDQRMVAIEEMISEIYAVTVKGEKPLPPGATEYKRALDAMLEGDVAPLTAYLRNGGEIPKPETLFPMATVQRGRRANLPTVAPTRRRKSIDKGRNASNGPVRLPETKEQRSMVQ